MAGTLREDLSTWSHESMRKLTSEVRADSKSRSLAVRRIGLEDCQDADKEISLEDLLATLSMTKFSDAKGLERLKRLLSSGEVNADEFFVSGDNLHYLADVIINGQDTNCQLLGVHCAANLAPLSEKNGLQLARALGPFLVTLLSSASSRLQESAATALGNMALTGFKVAKVLVNQEAVATLTMSLDQNLDSRVLSAFLYSLYHILHVMIAEENFAIDELPQVTEKCVRLLQEDRGQPQHKPPVELYWLLFLMSCDPNRHEELAEQAVIGSALESCTYEIFKKADSRPLVKVVTPLIRMLANLCGGPLASERACLAVVRYPDITAILMSLLATNYVHLVRETLWLFANIINNDSVVVQEQFVELAIMDKLEFHTVQAVQKIDPYVAAQQQNHQYL